VVILYFNVTLLKGWTTGVRFQTGAGNFSHRHRTKTVSGAHPDSSLMGSGGTFPGSKATGQRSWPAPPSSTELNKCMEIYLRSPMYLHGVMFSEVQEWRGV